MKKWTMILGFLAALGLVITGPARAQDQGNVQTEVNTPDQNGVSFQTFYDSLATQGTWINTTQYGQVWQPTESDPNWRPYTYGHWVNTDQGMTWESDEPFGWAVYHYGRWTNLNGYGWVWVPGYTWAPAWVSWREDDSDVGWAPLPPDSDYGIDYYGDDYYPDWAWGYGYHIGDDCDVAFGIGAWWYNFCPVAYIGDPDCWRHFRDRRDNFALIGNTRNVTNINFRRDGAGRFGRVTADGPSVAALNAHARTPIRTATLAEASDPRGAGLHGRTLDVYAPKVDPATVRTARANGATRSVGAVTVNRGTDINRPVAVNSHLAPAAATAGQVRAAQVAERNVTSAARVDRGVQPTRGLTRSLTSLRTETGRTTHTGTAGVTQTANGTVRQTVSPQERAFTGTATERAATAAPADRAFTGTSTERAFTGASHASAEANYPRTRVATGNAVVHPTYRPAISATTYSHPEVRSGESAFHASTPSYYHPQPAFHYSAPATHYSAPAFHSSAPAAHFSAPAAHFSAPAAAAHFSGGGGGHAAGGGGGGHAGGGNHR